MENEKPKRSKKKIILTIVVCILFLCATYIAGKYTIKFIRLYFFNINVDTDGDGWPDLNVDTTGDKVCDVNCDNNHDNKPEYNLGYKKITSAFFNLDTNGDKQPDKNLINQDLNNDGICDLNCTVKDEVLPSINLDFDMDGVAELNIDFDNDQICDLNCDLLGNKTISVNVDINNDNKPETNIDTNKDGVADINISYYNDFKVALFNIDKNNDNKADFNLINQDTDNDGKCDLNCDLDNDNIPDVQIDLDGDKIADINLDTNKDGLADMNFDLDKDGVADVNIDLNQDGYPELLIDTNNDGKADINFDFNHDNKADVNVDTNGDLIADYNVINQDTNNDGKCDLNCTKGGFKPVYNIDIDGDKIPDLSVDIDNDEIGDANYDSDNDGIADTNTINVKTLYNEPINEIAIENNKEYNLTYLNDMKISRSNIKPGYSAKRNFTVKNNTNKTINYDITFEDIINDMEYTTRLNFGLTMNNQTLIDINMAQVPYPNQNGVKLVSNMEIKPGETQNYEFTLSYLNNELMNQNKLFYGAFKVKSN